jgi:hypothetical protein
MNWNYAGMLCSIRKVALYATAVQLFTFGCVKATKEVAESFKGPFIGKKEIKLALFSPNVYGVTANDGSDLKIKVSDLDMIPIDSNAEAGGKFNSFKIEGECFDVVDLRALQGDDHFYLTEGVLNEFDRLLAPEGTLYSNIKLDKFFKGTSFENSQAKREKNFWKTSKTVFSNSDQSSNDNLLTFQPSNQKPQAPKSIDDMLNDINNQVIGITKNAGEGAKAINKKIKEVKKETKKLSEVKKIEEKPIENKKIDENKKIEEKKLIETKKLKDKEVVKEDSTPKQKPNPGPKSEGGNGSANDVNVKDVVKTDIIQGTAYNKKTNVNSTTDINNSGKLQVDNTKLHVNKEINNESNKNSNITKYVTNQDDVIGLGVLGANQALSNKVTSIKTPGGNLVNTNTAKVNLVTKLDNSKKGATDNTQANLTTNVKAAQNINDTRKTTVTNLQNKMPIVAPTMGDIQRNSDTKVDLNDTTTDNEDSDIHIDTIIDNSNKLGPDNSDIKINNNVNTSKTFNINKEFNVTNKIDNTGDIILKKK